MANTITLSVAGMEEFQNKIGQMDLDTLKRMTGTALRKAALVVRAEAAAQAALVDDSRTPENISENFAVQKNSKLSKQGKVGYRVGVLGGAQEGSDKPKGPGKDTWYWRLVEFGHNVHTKDGLKRVAPNPFFRRAIAKSRAAAQKQFEDTLMGSLDREIKKR